MGLRDLKNVFKRKEYDRPPAPPPPGSQPNEEPIRDSNPAPTSTQPVNGKDILSNPIATGEPPSLFKRVKHQQQPIGCCCDEKRCPNPYK